MNEQIRVHNESVLESIQPSQQFYFEKEMFFINRLAHSKGGRLIQFGGNSSDFVWPQKTVEGNWPLWIAEFERLLTQLYWIEADVHFKPEYASVQSFSWRVDLLKWSPYIEKALRSILPEYWDLTGNIDWAK